MMRIFDAVKDFLKQRELEKEIQQLGWKKIGRNLFIKTGYCAHTAECAYDHELRIRENI